MFALSAYFFSGCSSDYLDVDQTESISTKDIELFNNDAGAATFVTAIYSKFLDWNMSSFSWNGMSSIASDDADKGSYPKCRKVRVAARMTNKEKKNSTARKRKVEKEGSKGSGRKPNYAK